MNFNQKVIMAKDYARFYEKKESMMNLKAAIVLFQNRIVFLKSKKSIQE